MIAIKDGLVVRVRMYSNEMVDVLKAGGRLYKEDRSLYLCPSKKNRNCGESSPKRCRYCKNGICNKDLYK